MATTTTTAAVVVKRFLSSTFSPAHSFSRHLPHQLTRWSHTSATSIRPSPSLRASSKQQLIQSSPFSSSSASTENLTLRFRASSTGEWYTINDAQPGETIKDVAKRHDLPSIEATCGGQCECATCHAYIVTAAEGEGDSSKPELDAEPPEEVFPEKSEAEDDMLDYAIDRRSSSRLTCQVKVTPEIAQWMDQNGGWIELPRF
ncbi:hypothetical protein A4X09_0g2275 [Tilletia walkeri]|uniref:2Fe-2S ferredoxin-type domain-containing protein n=1 Tax=Tilletia walkeri TaxID=117179 RepID=A0A8X7NA38_9BASI|nr:hypothetical protein A4X09_0g2275 [Tilletia walkeri]